MHTGSISSSLPLKHHLPWPAQMLARGEAPVLAATGRLVFSMMDEYKLGTSKSE